MTWAGARDRLTQLVTTLGAWDRTVERAAMDLIWAVYVAGGSKRDAVNELRRVGLTKRNARALVAGVYETRAFDEAVDDEATAVCPHCLTPVERFDHFCPACTAPVTTHATTDPYGQVFSLGHMYRRAASGAGPNRLILYGVWLILGPLILSNAGAIGLLLWMALSSGARRELVFGGGGVQAIGPDGPSITEAALFALIGGAGIALQVWILSVVTRRHRRRRAAVEGGQ